MDSKGVGSPKKPTTSGDDSALTSQDMSLTQKVQNVQTKNSLCIETLQPYSIQSKPSKFTRNTLRTNETLTNFNKIFANENWARYLQLTVVSGAFSAAELECTLLQNFASRELKFKPINSYQWLIETSSKEQSQIYLTIKKIGKAEITIEKHETLNCIQGTVVLSTSFNDEGLPNKNIILMSLQARGYDCRNVELYEIPSRKTQSLKLRIAKITFEGNHLPKDIIIEGTRKEVRPYIPKPLQCKKCGKFGHLHHRCTNKEVCLFCGSDEHSTTWNCGSPKCVNCKGDHHTRSRECVVYKYNIELKLLMTRSGMNYKEARRELYTRGIKDPAQNLTYAAASKANQSNPVGKLQDKSSADREKINKTPTNEKTPTAPLKENTAAVADKQNLKSIPANNQTKDRQIVEGKHAKQHVTEKTNESRQKRSLTPDGVDTENKFEILDEMDDLSQCSIVLGRGGPKLRRTRSADRNKD